PASPMGTARIFPGLALLSTGQVLAVGGTADLGDPAADNGEIYNPTTNTWTPVSNNLPGGARLDPLTAALPGGRALVAGGATKGTSTSALSTADVYDAASNSFTAAGNAMSSQRIGGAAIPLADGRVLVAGGETAATPAAAPATATADVFNPGSSTFSPAASMSVARAFPAATALGDGRV